MRRASATTLRLPLLRSGSKQGRHKQPGHNSQARYLPHYSILTHYDYTPIPSAPACPRFRHRIPWLRIESGPAPLSTIFSPAHLTSFSQLAPNSRPTVSEPWTPPSNSFNSCSAPALQRQDASLGSKSEEHFCRSNQQCEPDYRHRSIRSCAMHFSTGDIITAGSSISPPSRSCTLVA